MREIKPFVLVLAAGLTAELVTFVVLTALGASNEFVAIASLVCLCVTSFYAGDVGSRESHTDDHQDARHDR